VIIAAACGVAAVGAGVAAHILFDDSFTAVQVPAVLLMAFGSGFMLLLAIE